MNHDLKILYSCHQTIIQLLNDRGFKVPSIFNCNTLEDFKLLNNNKQLDIFVKEPHKCFVKFIIMNKARPQIIREIIEELKKKYTEEEGEIIIILKNKPHNSLFKVSKEYKNIQFFWLSELINNITHHKLNPKFTKLTDEETIDILKHYNLHSKLQLPIMLISDPISKYFNYKSGDVCKVYKNSPTNGEYISYRYVK